MTIGDCVFLYSRSFDTAIRPANLFFLEPLSRYCRARIVASFLWPTLNEIVFHQHNERILHHRILQLARVGVCVRCARGPTKRCITLPGVNKPRGRGPARGSPLRLRLLLRLCISSATPFTLIYERRPQYSFFPPPIPASRSPAIIRVHSPLSLSLFEIVRRPQTPLVGWSPANYFLPGELI